MIDRQEVEMEGRHVASLTHSDMIMLNLEELQAMGAFRLEVVLLDKQEPKMHAYDQGEDTYLLLVPLPFYHRSRPFIQLLCLCSHTLTIPAEGPYLREVEQLLASFGQAWSKKRGSNVTKLYIEQDCRNSFLDFVSFQAIQFEGHSCRDLIAMKKENALQYCLNSFKEDLLPFIYENEEDRVQNALESCTSQLKDIFLSLACSQRFQTIYEETSPHSGSLHQLLAEIERIAVGRNITTVGDEECEELVNLELSKIVARELAASQEQLCKMKRTEQQVFLTKILHGILQKVRSFGLEINDKKYLFLNSKVMERVYSLHQDEARSREEQAKSKEEQVRRLTESLLLQQQEVERLQGEIQALTVERAKQSSIEVVSGEQACKTKRVQTESQQNNIKKPSLTIKDVKEPLQVICSSNNSSLASKTQKTGLQKTKPRPREGFKRPEDIGKSGLLKKGEVSRL